MTKGILFLLVFWSLLFGSTYAFAQSYQLGTATYSGNACPPGTAAVSVSPDATSISFLFDQFHIGFKPGVIISKQGNCTIRVPITVSPGYMLEATTLDYRGFVDLPAGTTIGLLTNGIVSTNRLGNRLAASSGFKGPVTDSFSLSQKVAQSLPGQRKCTTNAYLQLSITALITSRAYLNTEFTLDSADLGIAGGGLTMGVSLKPCTP